MTGLPLFFRRLRQIGSPITPSPMKPIVFACDMLYFAFAKPPAAVPAILPNTAPAQRPVPPG